MPCQLYDKYQKILPNDTIEKEFFAMISQLVDDEFSLSSFDKLIEIQVNLDDFASILKKAKRTYVKVRDSISHVHAIASSTTVPVKSEMQALLARFKEFQKTNEGENEE